MKDLRLFCYGEQTYGSGSKGSEHKVWIFPGLSVRENPDETRLTSSSFADPLRFASLCWWPLFSLFSGASLHFLLSLLFAWYLPFYLCIVYFSFAFLYFGVLLASSLTFLCVFRDSPYTFYFLPSLVVLSLSIPPIFTKNPRSTNLNYSNFHRLTKL